MRGRRRFIAMLVTILFLLIIINEILSSTELRRTCKPLHPNKSTIPFNWLKITCVSHGFIYCLILLYHEHITVDYIILFFNGLFSVNIVVQALKLMVKRQRPDWRNEFEPYESFPSGHTSFSMSWCVFMILLFKKKRKKVEEQEMIENSDDLSHHDDHPQLNESNKKSATKTDNKLSQSHSKELKRERNKEMDHYDRNRTQSETDIRMEKLYLSKSIEDPKDTSKSLHELSKRNSNTDDIKEERADPDHIIGKHKTRKTVTSNYPNGLHSQSKTKNNEISGKSIFNGPTNTSTKARDQLVQHINSEIISHIPDYKNMLDQKIVLIKEDSDNSDYYTPFQSNEENGYKVNRNKMMEQLTDTVQNQSINSTNNQIRSEIIQSTHNNSELGESNKNMLELKQTSQNDLNFSHVDQAEKEDCLLNQDQNNNNVPMINENTHENLMKKQNENPSILFHLFLYLLNIFYLTVPVIVGISRILDRKHHISDVVAGAILAIIIGGGIRLMYHHKVDRRTSLLLHTCKK